MEREQQAVADQARLRERSRIASDMHDSLGHELSLIAVRAAALEVHTGLGLQQQVAAREYERRQDWPRLGCGRSSAYCATSVVRPRQRR